MREQFQPALSSGGFPHVLPNEPGKGLLSRLWSGRPPLPDYFRDMLTTEDCLHPEHLASII